MTPVAAGVRVRLANGSDTARVMAFIESHWRAGHVLGRDRSLLAFQHGGGAGDGDRDGEGLDFAIAERDGEPGLLGVLGFIRASRYDPDLAGRDTVWLALWKVRNRAPAGLGLRLHAAVAAATAGAAQAVNGINDAVMPIYRALGYEVVPLTHWVMINPSATGTPRLLDGLGAAQRPEPAPGDAELVETDADELLAGAAIEAGRRAAQRPSKSAAYFAGRYLGHPSYRYRVMRVVCGRVCRGLVALREDRAAGSSALRLVDFYGDDAALASAGSALRAVLVERGAEYLDAYAHGLDAGAWSAAGFEAVEPGGGLVVPSYFTPFERRNVTVTAAWKPGPGGFVVMKADGDQDRPS